MRTQPSRRCVRFGPLLSWWLPQLELSSLNRQRRVHFLPTIPLANSELPVAFRTTTSAFTLADTINARKCQHGRSSTCRCNNINDQHKARDREHDSVTIT